MAREKSLDDYRLTHPPQDNAYYYYSRLLESSLATYRRARDYWRSENASRFSPSASWLTTTTTGPKDTLRLGCNSLQKTTRCWRLNRWRNARTGAWPIRWPSSSARPAMSMDHAELVKKSSRAKGGRVPPARRSRSVVQIHEDSEHRRNARTRAQQILSQALCPLHPGIASSCAGCLKRM